MKQAVRVENNKRYKSVAITKAQGETYTPNELATFVARQIVEQFDFTAQPKISVLDPAIGDGALTLALLTEVRKKYDGAIEVVTFDTNAVALATAKKRIIHYFPNCDLRFSNQDFLQFVMEAEPKRDLLSFGNENECQKFDLIIANPPYVRTQILGAEQAQRLASAFGLSGRVDLYHAFLLAMTKVLDPYGSAGFIVSNRFMSTKGGGALRALLRSNLNLRGVWDLGDTKLFDAAVLPAVIVASGLSNAAKGAVSFTAIYETEKKAQATTETAISALEYVGVVQISDGRRFSVKSGTLGHSTASDDVWRVASESGDAWLATIKTNTWKSFGQLGKIRVGVKTCADKVFIRHDWEGATEGSIPELVRPLTTHHGAGRYRATIPKKERQILYPHEVIDGKRQAIEISKNPKSESYLEAHRSTLESRSYVIEAGRRWYEIWVPQDPEAWTVPKLVFRDISERPTFWLDLDGTIVNGDCYWMIVSEREDNDYLWLAVAVANSTFIEAFYDHCFNNKLYAGRRRFITQYVEQFPLPDPTLDVSKVIIKIAKAIYEANHSADVEQMEKQIDLLVWQSFGVNLEK